MPYMPYVPQPPASRNPVPVIVGGIVAVVIGLMVVVGAEGTERVVLPLLASVLVSALVMVAVVLAAARQKAEALPLADEKPKREGMDMYALIDRLVDDLDDDEAAYLRQRLDARERGLQSDLADETADLLDRRAEDRRAGRR